MEPVLQKILVVGGNGFVGSAVCRTALARGMQVASVSPSGKPWQTPKGHTPAWVHKVEWHQGDALQPDTYQHLLPGVTAVVHTIGTLFEKSGYKSAIKDGNVPHFVSSVAAGIAGSSRSANPLEKEQKRKEGSYEVVNRDTALRVCEQFLRSTPTVGTAGPRAFVYISAEDCNRPLVPSGYIEAKREAELGIERMMLDHPSFRGVYIRPSLIYHPHYRPLISPVAALLDLSATVHASLPAGLPTPSNVLRTLGAVLPRSAAPGAVALDTGFDAMARALTIPPIHVDHVAEAVCIAADNRRQDVRGPYGVKGMRELIGWHQRGQQQVGHA
ncbi:NAD(P)-binding protein [Epithele typhae]|uniref:NAD(P)-binding protein n=1 Tax=Epithele typhae TaxID=378194 RepID=UPI0020076D79|nr:NAD(P)-binding protein [Epithele typhae]KAH9946090.1 NAD(P)-binding protein [Epithele typhae]